MSFAIIFNFIFTAVIAVGAILIALTIKKSVSRR